MLASDRGPAAAQRGFSWVSREASSNWVSLAVSVWDFELPGGGGGAMPFLLGIQQPVEANGGGGQR